MRRARIEEIPFDSVDVLELDAVCPAMEHLRNGRGDLLVESRGPKMPLKGSFRPISMRFPCDLHTLVDRNGPL